MKALLFLFLLISPAVSAQLELKAATMQTINQGAAPVSVTNYKVTLKKSKCAAWSIDSVTSLLGHRIEYRVMKVDAQGSATAQHQRVEKYSKKDKGTYLITFASRKSRGSGRPNAPQNLQVDTENYSGGVIIHYTWKKKPAQIKLQGFDELESVDAP